MQMLAETMVAALRKGNEGCFTCGNKNHLKGDCPKKANLKKKKHNNLQKSALAAADVEECIGPKIVNVNLTLKENLFWKTPSRDPRPGPFQQKPGTNSIFSLKPSTSGSAAIDIPALFLDNMKLMSSI